VLRAIRCRPEPHGLVRAAGVAHVEHGALADQGVAIVDGRRRDRSHHEPQGQAIERGVLDDATGEKLTAEARLGGSVGHVDENAAACRVEGRREGRAVGSVHCAVVLTLGGDLPVLVLRALPGRDLPIHGTRRRC